MKRKLQIIKYHLLGLTLLGLNPNLSAQIVEGDSCAKFLGNITQSSRSDNWYDYWNQVTPENAGKWGSVERTRDVMNWTDLDLAYNTAKDSGYLFKQHVFVWGSQQPAWIDTLSQEEQLEEIEEWIMAFCERYPDTDIIEVVNEPVNAPPFGQNGNANYADALGGAGESGRDWILNAFRLAQEHCPNAALMINEYGILNGAGTRRSYLNIVDLLIANELIDAVGIQAHEFTVFNMSAADITESLDEIAAKGLPIYVTELDIGSGDNQQAINDALQLEKYQEVFPALWKHPAVAGVTLWGYEQTRMWRSTAHLVRSDRTERPALEWLKNYVTPANSKCEGVLSVNEFINREKVASVYPNPSSGGRITVTSENPFVRLDIIDINGKRISTQSLAQPARTLDLSLDLKPGIYLLEIHGSSKVEIQRFIVK